MKYRSSILILLVALASASILAGSSLSRYRPFQPGMPLSGVANEIGTASPLAKTISSRPERIEELDWRSNRFSSSSRPDSVRGILFRFYDGGLFEIMVMYDRDHTSGLTDADMTEALTAVYGPSLAPATKEMAFNAGYNVTVRLIAQWADAQDLVSLVGFPYDGGFGVGDSRIGPA
jgi:hypothetical protein